MASQLPWSWIAPAVLLASAGCSYAPAEDHPPADIAAPQDEEAGAPYLAINVRTGSSFPDALGAGRFSVADRCVVFAAAGEPGSFTPIFPAGTRLREAADGAAAGLTVRGSPVAFGRTYRVSGGEILLAGATDVQPHSPIPDECPRRYFLVGRVTSSG